MFDPLFPIKSGSLISYLLILANIFFCGAIIFYSGRSCWLVWRKRPVCTLTTLIGLIWLGLYIYVFLSDTGLLPLRHPDFDTTWFRPTVTLTLAIMAIMALGRWRRNGRISSK